LRAAETFEFPHSYPNADPRTFTASAGFYSEGGAIGEVFVHAIDGKERLVNVDQHDASIVLSFALHMEPSSATWRERCFGARTARRTDFSAP
jgi:hypothetical protein